MTSEHWQAIAAHQKRYGLLDSAVPLAAKEFFPSPTTAQNFYRFRSIQLIKEIFGEIEANDPQVQSANQHRIALDYELRSPTRIRLLWGGKVDVSAGDKAAIVNYRGWCPTGKVISNLLRENPRTIVRMDCSVLTALVDDEIVYLPQAHTGVATKRFTDNPHILVPALTRALATPGHEKQILRRSQDYHIERETSFT